MGFLYVAVAAVLNGLASYFLKVGISHGIKISLSEGIWVLFVTHAYLLIGLALFACNVLVYILALKQLPLSTAYPLMVALSFIVVSALSITFLNEQYTFLKLIGFLLIIVGVALVAHRLT